MHGAGKFTLLEAGNKPRLVQLVETLVVLLGLQGEALLNRNFAPILLSQKSTNDSALEAPLVAASDVIRDFEEWERVQSYLKARVRRLLSRKQLVGELVGHDASALLVVCGCQFDCGLRADVVVRGIVANSRCLLLALGAGCAGEKRCRGVGLARRKLSLAPQVAALLHSSEKWMSRYGDCWCLGR
jgi:hypothetical protein